MDVQVGIDQAKNLVCENVKYALNEILLLLNDQEHGVKLDMNV